MLNCFKKDKKKTVNVCLPKNTIEEILKNSTFDEFLKFCENIPNEKFNEPIDGIYPLHIVCGKSGLTRNKQWTNEQYFQAIQYLVEEKKVDINCDFKNLKPIHIICLKTFTVLRGDIRLKIIKYLIDNNADLECVSDNACKPIHLLFWSDFDQYDLDALYYMIEKGASIDSPDYSGRTLIHLICSQITFCLYYRPQISKESEIESKLLFQALKFLIDKGACLENKNKQGKTPFYYLCNRIHFYLDDDKCDDYNNRFPIEKYPINEYHKEAILYMIKKGVDSSSCYNELVGLFKQDYLKQNVVKYIQDLATSDKC